MGARGVAPARAAALAVASDVRRRRARARDVMRASSRVRSLDARDLALAERLVLGMVAASGTLDAILDAHLPRPSSLHPRVRDALRISSFELLWLGTPDAVAVSQGVELVRSVSPRAAGLANAVLRRVSREDAPRVRDALESARALAFPAAAPMGDRTLPRPDAGTLALAAGWPAWLAGGLASSLGEAGTAAMAVCALDPAPVWVSANVALHDAGECRELLAEAGMEPRPCDLAGVWELPSARGLASSGLVESADIVVSDLAARLVALIASPAPGARVLEVGQGRGTKTLLLEAAASAAGGPCSIVGIDSVAHKTRVASERLSHGWDGWVDCVTADGRALARNSAPEAIHGSFDLVFVDAPCSGTGTMRRHPEIAWSLDEDSVRDGGELPRLQLDILRAASSRVAPGGNLVFSTCSVLDAEGEGVIDAFLSSGEGSAFRLVPALEARAVRRDPCAAFLVREGSDGRGMFRSVPSPGSFDGHFCARLERRR